MTNCMNDWIDDGISLEAIESMDEDFNIHEAIDEFSNENSMVSKNITNDSDLLTTRNWTRFEDLRLLQFVAENGKVWRKSAVVMKGRSDDSCRQRYHRLTSSSDDEIPISKPREPRFAWTPQEDHIILQHLSMGLSWVDLAAHLPGRTSHGVRNRAYRLTGQTNLMHTSRKTLKVLDYADLC